MMRPGVVAALTLAMALAPAGLAGAAEPVIFSGFGWDIKVHEDTRVGPGNNYFCKDNVEIGESGLILRLDRHDLGAWCSAEVIGPSFGYGRYRFIFRVNGAKLDSNVILGLFTWSDNPAHNHSELDFELGRWGNPASATNAQCVVQPAAQAQNVARFEVDEKGPIEVRLDWQAGHFACTVTSGDGAFFETHRFSQGIPPESDARVRMNLWLAFPEGPKTGKAQSVVIEEFDFEPMN